MPLFWRAMDACRVYICGREGHHLADALEDMRASRRNDIYGVSEDLGTEEGILNVFRKADAFWGGLNIGIPNAGLGTKGKLTTMSHKRAAAWCQSTSFTIFYAPERLLQDEWTRRAYCDDRINERGGG